MEKITKITKITLVLLLVLVSLLFGFFIGSWQANFEIQRLNAQIETAKKFFPQVSEVRALPGAIKSIEHNIITIELPDSSFMPFVTSPFDNIPLIRKVEVRDATKIVNLIPKDQAAYQKEVEAFQKLTQEKSSANLSLNDYPVPFTEQIITLSNLKVGGHVAVEADENIKAKESFTVTKITCNNC